MIIEYKKTKTGWKFKFACIVNESVLSDREGWGLQNFSFEDKNEIVHTTILCSHRPDFEEAKKSAMEHITKTLLNFKAFPNEEEYKTLPHLF